VRRRIALSVAALALLAPTSAHALELGKIAGKAIALEVTEVSIVAQRFDSREQDPVNEGGAWGEWVNRLEAKLDWNHFEVGVRLDSALYWNTLKEQCKNPGDIIPASGNAATCSALAPKIARDDLARYQNSIYPAKLWGNYKYKGVEVVVGDAYVQFARGLVLSMRKLDDLGIDNTIRGFKGAITKGPFSVTLIGGLANPSRVDEASGQALFNQKAIPNTNPAFSARGPQPTFGLDQIFGAEIQAGREKPVVFTTSMAYINRCAPNAYTGPASSQPGRALGFSFPDSLLGYCDDDSVATWLGGLPTTGTIRQARHVTTVAQAIEVPKLGKFGSLYLVGVIQHRGGIDDADTGNFDQGTALYATYTGSIGKKVTNTVEFKDYRNFYPAVASINATQVSAFSPVAYSAVPTIESITQDNMLNNFNICVDGLRVRTDVRTSDALLLYGQAILSQSRGEQNARCSRSGDIIGAKGGENSLTDWVFDGLVGMQWDFDNKQSHAYATLGGRQDWVGTGDTFLWQLEATYNVSKAIDKHVAIEAIGRHRVRYEKTDNLGPTGAEAWVEGENYIGLSVAPHWVFTQGFEYSTRDLPPNVSFLGIDNYPSWLYLSLGGVYKITKNSNIKLFVGQQRGGLKCISGVCRVFPPFEGARLELTLRF
jgi:hypothetical protein